MVLHLLPQKSFAQTYLSYNLPYSSNQSEHMHLASICRFRSVKLVLVTRVPVLKQCHCAAGGTAFFCETAAASNMLAEIRTDPANLYALKLFL